MSASPLRIDRARATPAKPRLDKLPKFDHSLHFDPSLGVDDSTTKEGSSETPSTASDVQDPLRQSISRDVSPSILPGKRPSMLDITAPYTGEAPLPQDEEIFTAEQEGDIVDYINEAQDQDEAADWPLYPSKVSTRSSLESSNINKRGNRTISRISTPFPNLIFNLPSRSHRQSSDVTISRWVVSLCRPQDRRGLFQPAITAEEPLKLVSYTIASSTQ